MGTPGALSISAGMYARPALTSPMAQLTCLLPSHSSENLTQNESKTKQISTPTQSLSTGKFLYALKLRAIFYFCFVFSQYKEIVNDI